MKSLAMSLVATTSLAAATDDTTFKSLKFDLQQVLIDKSGTIENHLNLEQDKFDEDDDPAEVDDSGKRSSTLELIKEDYRYQAPMYFGSSKNKAMMSFDTGSSYTVVTSDICAKTDCASTVYKPGTSETTFNLNQRYQLDIDQGGHATKLNVYSFIDSVCLQETDSTGLCLDEFQFYAISKQKGLSPRQDGIVGMAPTQTNKFSDEGPSFVSKLRDAGVIDRAMFGIFISRFESKTHSIQIGDYETGLVHGGEPHLHWFSMAIPEKTGMWRWQTDITDAYIGDHTIFQHSFKWVEVNAAYSSVGLTSEDFEKASAKLMDIDQSIECDLDKCHGKNECESYKGRMPELHFTLSNRVNATLPGDELLSAKTGSSDFKCDILLSNSGDFYLMGEPFLRYYYSVYDMDNNKIALGRVIDFDAPPVEEEVPEGVVDPSGHSSRDDDQNFIRNASIFVGIVIVFFAFACCLQKRRVDPSQSGSQAARTARKQLRLTEDDPNRSLIEGQQENGKLHFVGGSDDDEEDDDDEQEQVDYDNDETIPESVLEAENV